jgi:hypothetical protein
MACSSCGKSYAARIGNTINTAIVFGEPTNEVIRVRVVGDVSGISRGAVKYVRGSGVQSLVDDGTFAKLAGGPYTLATPGGYTLYYVGSVGYATMEAARVRSGQTGEEIVVRTFGQ